MTRERGLRVVKGEGLNHESEEMRSFTIHINFLKASGTT